MTAEGSSSDSITSTSAWIQREMMADPPPILGLSKAGMASHKPISRILRAERELGSALFRETTLSAGYAVQDAKDGMHRDRGNEYPPNVRVVPVQAFEPFATHQRASQLRPGDESTGKQKEEEANHIDDRRS